MIYLSIWKHSLSTLLDICQVHKNSGNPMTATLQVNLVSKIIEVGIILLTNFIMQNLNRLGIF
jgi:hypothetical protein